MTFLKQQRILRIVMVVVMTLIARHGFAMTRNSQDAYVRIDEQKLTIMIGTNSVEETMQLAQGKYLLKSLRNRTTNRDYVTGSYVSDEFRATVNGKVVTGSSEEWHGRGVRPSFLRKAR